MEKKRILDVNFSQLSTHPQELQWINEPRSASLISQAQDSTLSEFSCGLKLTPDPQTDFWHRTYYDPPIEKCNGHILAQEIPWSRDQWTVETSFSLYPQNQFDQAGLIVFIDPTHWIKTGIECVDGRPRMSCVVTNGHSDWSTQPWGAGLEGVAMRLSYIRNSYVVECKGHGKDSWEFIRIAHLLGVTGEDCHRVGLYGCAPTASGMSVVFHYLTTTGDVTFGHHA